MKRPSREVLEKLYNDQKMSQAQIAKLLGCSQSAVSKWMKEYGIPTRSISEANHLRWERAKGRVMIDDEFKAFLDGLLMGDGSLEFNGWSTRYSQRCVKRGWLEHIKHVFSEHGIEAVIFPTIMVVGGKAYRAYDIKTKFYADLNIFWKRWYSTGRKRVPRDVNVASPIFLANWYMGDGYLKRDKNKKPSIWFATNSFPREDLEWILSQLREKLGLEGSITKEGKIRLSSKCTDKFINIVKEHIHKDFIYKITTNWRPSWDEYFMRIAHMVAQRSTCLRRKVGAVLVKDNRIICQGYNGAPKGLPHCIDIGRCLREELNVPSGQRHELCRGLHAEQNCIIQAAVFGVSTRGATLYTTTYPCAICAKMIINAEIYEVVYDADYEDALAKELFEQAGVKVRRFHVDPDDP